MKVFYNSKGFTLIELIGVMAIIAILAATIAPSVIRDIDRSLGEAEQTKLRNLAADLETYISINKTIPAASNWSTLIASMSSLPVNRVAQNERLHNRAYYVDPRFFSNSDSNFTQYTQSNGLSSRPVSPRIIFASNLKGSLPANLNNSTNFNAVWNQTSGAAILESQDVKIQRVNLQGSFHRVLLTNNNVTDSPGYRLETGVTQSVSSTNTEIFVLKDTKLSLIEAPFTNNIVGQALLVTEASSFAFTDDSGSWQWQNL